MKENERKKTETLIIDGNAIYELDLECIQKKQWKRKQQQNMQQQNKGEENYSEGNEENSKCW